jgi:hypothetical protein
MGGPQMGGPPMGGPMGMQRPIRRGTSKAVPVVVSAGLAVGVFCGLLFGVGTGKNAAIAAPSASNVKAKTEGEEPKPEPGAAPTGLGATAAAPVVKAGSAAAVGSGSPPAVAAVGSAAPAVGSGSGSATPAVEEKKVLKVTFKLKPESAEKDATITVDGKEITGLVTEIPIDTKSMKVEIKASGYRTLDKKQDIVEAPGNEMLIEYELVKKPTSSHTRPPKRPERPTNAGGGGGLIDI